MAHPFDDTFSQADRIPVCEDIAGGEIGLPDPAGSCDPAVDFVRRSDESGPVHRSVQE
jgi:hypothetical protein